MEGRWKILYFTLFKIAIIFEVVCLGVRSVIMIELAEQRENISYILVNLLRAQKLYGEKFKSIAIFKNWQIFLVVR